jgi:hypothetical protein
MLLNWAIHQADAQSPQLPIYVVAFPNARVVYLHLGFRGLEGEGKERVVVREGVETVP